jgi:hypothetical protein
MISLGPDILKNVKNLNQLKGEASNVKLEGVYWFALDKGVVVRMESTITQEALIDVGTAPSGGGSAGGSGTKKGGPVGAGGDDPGMGAGSGSITDPSGFQFEISPQVDKYGNASIFQSKGGRGGRGGVGGPPGGRMGEGGGDDNGGDTSQNGGRGGRFGQNRGSGGGGPRKMVMRVRVTYVADLEI